MGYTREAIKGISWVGAFRVSSRGIAILRTFLLARILVDPTKFGLVGIATLVLGFVEMLTETGINIFLVQEEKVERYLDTAWTVSILRGIIIATIIVASAPFVATFFHAPDAKQLLLLISLVPLIRGFINPAEVIFQKNLTFDREFWFRFSIFTIDSATAVILALFTHEASSLVWGFILGAAVEVSLSFLVIKPQPRFLFNIQRIQEVFHRGKWVTAFSVLNYAFQNVDNIVVGRLLGTFPLGLYQVGYRIASLPGEAVDSVSRVTFPVFAKIGGDKERLKKAFFKTTGVIAILTIPFGIGLFFFTKELVGIVLGQSWLEAVPAIKVLAIFGVIRAISSSTSALFLSVKKQEYVMAVTLVSLLGLGITIAPLVSRFGIVGAAIAAFVGSILALPVIVYCTWRVLR